MNSFLIIDLLVKAADKLGSSCAEAPFCTTGVLCVRTWGLVGSLVCAHMGISVGVQRGGGCRLRAVNSSVHVNRASNNPGSPSWLLRDYKRHHKSISSLTYTDYHASLYLGKLLFLITAQICLSGNSQQTSGRMLTRQIPGTLIEPDLPRLILDLITHIQGILREI